MAIPLIGISCEMKPPDPRRSFSRQREILTLNRDYPEAILRCGGSPLIIPLMQAEGALEDLLKGLQGIILSGGDDVAAPHGEWQVRPECQLRSEHEHRLIEIARRRSIPILGICRGLQQLNVSFGGTLGKICPLGSREPWITDAARGAGPFGTESTWSMVRGWNPSWGAPRQRSIVHIIRPRGRWPRVFAPWLRPTTASSNLWKAPRASRCGRCNGIRKGWGIIPRGIIC